VQGARHQHVGGRLLGQLAGVHHHDAVGDLVDQRDVVGDHDHALDEPAVPEADQRLGHRLLGGDVQGGGDLVGDQQRGVQQGRQHHHHALFHPARQLDRVALQHLLRQLDQVQAAAQLVPHGAEADAPRLQQLGDHPADLAGGVHRAHRVLRDDGDLLEPEAVHPGIVGDGQLLAVQLDGAADVAHAAVQADQALAEGGLAAAGLPHQPHDLAVGDGEGDVVQRLHVAAQRPVPDLEVVDAEAHRAHISRSLGLKTSSRPTFMM
jgi:hypothetical protein